MCKWLREWNNWRTRKHWRELQLFMDLERFKEVLLYIYFIYKYIYILYIIFWCNRTEGRGGNRSNEAKRFSVAPRVRSSNRYGKFHFHLNRKHDLGFYIFGNIQIPTIQGPAPLGLVDLTLSRDFCLEISRGPFHPQLSHSSMDDSARLWKCPDN